MSESFIPHIQSLERRIAEMRRSDDLLRAEIANLRAENELLRDRIARGVVERLHLEAKLLGNRREGDR